MLKKYFNYLFLVLGLSILIYASFNIYKWYNDSRDMKNITATFKTIPKKEINTDDLINKALYNPPSNKNDSYYNYIDRAFLDVDLSDLKKKNEDVIAWLEVGGTNIDYPIVKGNDNKYYLNHTIEKKESRAGWLFMDYRNKVDNKDRNTIIYGHRRLDNTMFGTLIRVLNNDWFKDKNNHIIRMSNDYENTIWQIFSVYKIKKESFYLKTVFPNNSYLEFLNTIKKRSIYDFNTSLNNDDYILTLSTCYDNNGMRIVVHAKLIKKETKIN